jgi:PAS domain S-box-containing protein
MRAYAREVGADEEAVVEAFREVPVMSRERFGQIAQALYTLARQLSSIAYQNVQQARFITDYKRAEAALSDSECKYRSIVENAPFGITRSTREGKLHSVNPALASILKYDSAEELMETINRSSIQEVLFPEPSEREPLVENVFDCDSWYLFNNRLRCKDGSFVTCRVHSRRILDEDGQASEFESYQENITDKLEAEQALRESEEKFRVLAETSPVAIGLYKREHITYANPAMERLFGYSADDLGRMNFLEWVHEDSKGLVRSRAQAWLAGESVPGQYEIKCVTKDGEERDVLVSAGTMSHQGNLSGVASFLDITERKRSEELVRASLAEKEVLLKEIHHRVKNNLQVVSSLLFLQSQKFSDPELQTCFLESQSRICSMALAHEQLYQSKNLAEVSIKSYLENLVKQLQQVFPSPEQEVDCRLAVEDLELDIEKVVPCGLLVTELLSNAYKHAFADGRSGQIEISLQSSNGQIELAVADDGVGLPAEFDYRQAKTLGLQLVTALVNQLNGTLELERNNGTRFRASFAG